MNRTGVLLFLFFLFPAFASGEYRCSAVVKYRWKNTEGTEMTAYWATVERRGESEEAVRELTAKFAEREQISAADACRRLHQNLSGCVVSKTAAYQETMQGLPFSARTKLEDSIIADCELARGTCLGVEVSDPACVNLAPPPPEGEAEATEDKNQKKKK
jgi:hypothetical protein